MHKYKYTQDEVEKFPIYGLPEEEKLTFINDAVGRHRDQIKDAADLKFVLRMVSAAYFPSELEEAGRTLAQEIGGLYRYLIAERSQELGVSEKTMRAWVKRHGIGILRDNPEGNQKLFERLGYHQRISQKGTREWMDAYRATLKAKYPRF